MLPTVLLSLASYLCYGVLLTSAAPFEAHSRVKRAITTKPGVGTWLEPRPQLGFNADFIEMTETFRFILFSALQFSKLTAEQKTDEFWRPKSGDSDDTPAKYFYDACLETEAGQKFKDAYDKKTLTDSQVTLINVWGTFDNQYGHFAPWKFSQDGILAASCQVMSINVKDIPTNPKALVDFSKFKMEAESSTQMIKNMKARGWSVEQIAQPSHTRLQLETMIKKNKKQIG